MKITIANNAVWDMRSEQLYELLALQLGVPHIRSISIGDKVIQKGELIEVRWNEPTTEREI